MFVKVGAGKVQYVKSKVILELDDLFNILGYTNNSIFYRVNFIAQNNLPILCVAYDWGEYLQMIKYAREVIKKNSEENLCVV